MPTPPAPPPAAPPRYQIVVSASQLAVLRDACELLARCRLGQVAEACLEVLNAEGRAVVPYELAKQAENLIKAEVGLAPNQSWGVGHHALADVPFDLYQTFRYRLAWDEAVERGLPHADGSRNWATMMAVDYDPPAGYARQSLPLPAVTRLPPAAPPEVGTDEEETE